MEDTVFKRISGAFYRVYDALGYGFSRQVYMRALMVELDSMNIEYRMNHEVNVYYEGVIVGTHRVEFLVEGRIMICVRADESLTEVQEYRLENVLSAKCCDMAVVLNFGRAPEMFRKMGMGHAHCDENVIYSACA